MADNHVSSAPVKYDQGFAREFFSTENGRLAQKCMQCGMCAVSCATRDLMDHSPRRLFNLVRAGKKDEVLGSNTMWMCTSCCTCKVRCPRGIPLVDVMHDLKNMAIAHNYVSYPQAAFYQAFWQEVLSRGRAFEGGVMARYYLKRGWGEIKKAFEMKDLGMNMLKHGRLPMVPPRKIKGLKELQQIIEKAQALQRKEAK
ncbi:MAG: 4Fe-4S dicluster domain-containing protein [Desulfurispora sp.]|uniref:4Fe-4S dicluster domain-containing protein n=1 Tax=Desulfurispora sp. TaxID=3014275 RepID=UPI00404B95E6